MTVNVLVRGHGIPASRYAGQEFACKHCGRWPVELWVPVERPIGGKVRWGRRLIDACIADVVRELNRAGIYTAGCCCNHGQRPPNITLYGKREIDLVEARRLLDASPPVGRLPDPLSEERQAGAPPGGPEGTQEATGRPLRADLPREAW